MSIHLDNIDRIASELADANRVELAWFLRGYSERCYGVGRSVSTDEPYCDDYFDGRDAARDSRLADAFLAIVNGGADAAPEIMIAFIEMVRDRFVNA